MGQVDNDELRTNLIPYFITRNEFYSNEICRAITMSYIMTLPGLRGFWPGTVQNVPSSGNYDLVDVSGNGEHFGHTGNPQISGAGSHTNKPNVAFDGSTEWYSIADSAHWDILGTETGFTTGTRGLTIGAWVRFNNAASAYENVLSKRESGTNLSYWLQRGPTGLGGFEISNDGTTAVSVFSGADAIGATTWTFLVGRYDPSTELKLWINGDTYTNTTSIPASIFSGAADLFMAGRDDSATPGERLLEGRIGMAWICASQLDDRQIFALYEISRNIYGV